MLTNGMTAPTASGWPLTQLTMISPVCSVKPSARSGVLTVAWALQFSCCALASPAHRVSTASARITLRKSTIYPSPCEFRIESVEVLCNLSLKICSLKIRSANLGNFSVSGGESFSEAITASGLTENVTGGTGSLFLCLLCSTGTNTKLPLKPDAVKILIADCPRHVKRNPSPLTRCGVATSEIPVQNDARPIESRYRPCRQPVSHQLVSFFHRYCNATNTELLCCPPALRARGILSPGGVSAGMVTFTLCLIHICRCRRIERG